MNLVEHTPGDPFLRKEVGGFTNDSQFRIGVDFHQCRQFVHLKHDKWVQERCTQLGAVGEVSGKEAVSGRPTWQRAATLHFNWLGSIF